MAKPLFSAPSKISGAILRSQYKILLSLILLLGIAGYAVSQATLDFNRFYQSIYSEYGEQRSRLAKTWQTTMERVKPLPDQQKLQEVNNFINMAVRYQSDMTNNRVKDHWSSLVETFGKGVGDCEDYAIAKYVTLRLAGVEDKHLRMIYVKAFNRGRTEAHMVLGYYPTPDSMPLILDNLISEVKPASQRNDLKPVFSFNSRGLWAGLSKATNSDPMARLSRWQQVVSKLKSEGITL
ncbi:transglutaminase-like cysteine peptidase [Thiomicrorhabdus sp. 6S2-11]|jgi:predicted transglutaminase-like cysteine proteinase|uniref:Transglutaminase-like cysteine peptidase n=1 Tax=Thiomicrorhabdus marina TaxID=2818442 RepID=A0ABS3Q2I5_9GAMM|nr:transglutaminase-like cysteine peptidase [Thiomicrorhabdus marina]MBO1926373.1 transglutaminase-like cysteine peptidase [Thiomicrorhabdus marina]